MKKLLFSLTLLFPLLSSAQEEIKYGINIGPTYSDIRGRGYPEDFKYAFGYMIGLTTEIPLNQRWSFRTGINYERKSSAKKINYTSSGFITGPDGTGVEVTTKVNYKVTTTLDYVVIPINLKYYLDIYENNYITGGGFIAYNFDEGYKITGDKTTKSYEQNYKSFDYGISLSIGTKFKLNKNHELNVELRDNLGLANISTIDLEKISTNSICLIANWQFSL